MSVRVRVLLVALVVVLASLAVGVGFAAYRFGYLHGKQEVQQAMEVAASEKLTAELDLCIRALQSIVRNPKAFTDGERRFWRTQTGFLIHMLEEGLLPKLKAGEKYEPHGDVLAESKVYRQIEQARELLEKLPK
jgi:hypothetical protein